MNASYDTSTGYLTGSIVVNMFSMTGTGNTYTEPDAGQVAYGTSNLSERLRRQQQMQLRHLRKMAVTARVITVRKEKIQTKQQLLLTIRDSHNMHVC